MNPEWVVRDAAVVGLSGLIHVFEQSAEEIAALKRRLTLCIQADEEVVMRARAQWALAQFIALSPQ